MTDYHPPTMMTVAFRAALAVITVVAIVVIFAKATPQDHPPHYDSDAVRKIIMGTP